MAKKWPGYTDALEGWQEGIVRVAVWNAKKEDSQKEIIVKITGRPA